MAIDHKVYIALTEAELGVGEAIEGLPILLLDYGEGTKGLREEGQRVSMYGDLTHLGAEDFTLDADEVTDIHELLHHTVVESLVFAWAELITGDVDLDTSGRVLEL